jgi:hypothetical protein
MPERSGSGQILIQVFGQGFVSENLATKGKKAAPQGLGASFYSLEGPAVILNPSASGHRVQTYPLEP